MTHTETLKKLQAGYSLPESAMRGGADASGELSPPESGTGWAPRRIFYLATGQTITPQTATAKPAPVAVAQQAKAPAQAATPKPAGRVVKAGEIVTVGKRKFVAAVPNAGGVGKGVCCQCRAATTSTAGVVQWCTWTPTATAGLCPKCAATHGLTSAAVK